MKNIIKYTLILWSLSLILTGCQENITETKPQVSAGVQLENDSAQNFPPRSPNEQN